MEQTTAQTNERIAKANELKAIIETLTPCTKWGMTANTWIRPDGNGGWIVRIYINDKNRQPAAILRVNDNCSITPEWKRGHSMTRNEIAKALALSV